MITVDRPINVLLVKKLADDTVETINSKEEKEYIFTYFSYGIVAIIQKWIEKDCIDDIEKIVNIIKKAIGYEN